MNTLRTLFLLSALSSALFAPRAGAASFFSGGTGLQLTGGTLTGNVTFNDTGEGVLFHGGGSLLGASGGLTLAASGTNQNITLTPSGSGVVIGSAFLTPSAGYFSVGSRWMLYPGAAEGQIVLFNSGGTAADLRFQFGGTSSSYPAIMRTTASGAAFKFRLADDSGDADFTAGTATLSGAVNATSAAITGGGSIYLSAGSSTGGRIYPGDDAYVFKFLDVNASGGVAFESGEIADPAAPAANRGRLYFRDNGSGKTQLVVRFPTGAVQVIATEP